MPKAPRGAPRATRLMIDVFHAIHACGDLIRYWDLARRGGGVVLHATSRDAFSTQQEAEEAAAEIAARVQPDGYEAHEVELRAREGEAGGGWRASVEVSLV